MSIRELFTELWEKKFDDDPVPCNLLFLNEESDNLSSLASVLDSTERTISKLDKERCKQLFIRDFVIQRMDLAILARVRHGSQSVVPSKQECSDNDVRKSAANQLNYDDVSNKSPKSSPRTTYGQPMRAHGAAAQIAAVVTSAKNKFSFSSWSQSTRRSGHSPSRDKQAAAGRDDKYGKKPTAISRFYDAFGESNMTRACSAPSLLDDNVEYRPKKAPVSNKSSLCDISFGVPPRNIGSPNSRDSVLYNSRESTLSDFVGASETGESGASADIYLETDIDAMISCPPPLPPPVDRTSKMDYPRKQQPRQRQPLYEEPIEFRKEAASEMTEEDSEKEDDVSSDEEPLYFNLLLLKEHTLGKASQLYSNTECQILDHIQSPVMTEQRIEDPFLTLLRKPDLLQDRVDNRINRRSMALALDSDSDELDVLIPGSEEDEKRRLFELGVNSCIESEESYLKILEELTRRIDLCNNNVFKSPRNAIPADDIGCMSVLSQHVSQLSQIHRQFVDNLNQTDDRQQTASAFYSMVSLEYTIADTYVKNYAKVVVAIHHSSSLIADVLKCKVEELVNFKELLHKPIERFEKTKLTLQDLIKHTSTSSAEYDTLQKTFVLVQNYFSQLVHSAVRDQRANEQYLIAHTIAVEKVAATRKLRHIFLFKNILVCARQCLSGREQDRMSFEVKWFIPLSEIVLDDSMTSQDDRQLVENRLQDIEALQHKVSNLRSDLKVEKKRAKHSSDAQRQSSFKIHNKNAERFRKKLIEQKVALIKAAPCLPLRLIHRKLSKAYTLLMASDYERATWRTNINGLIVQCGSANYEPADVQKLLDSVKIPKLSTLSAMLGTDDFSLEEEYMFGSLCIKICSLHGLKQTVDVFCCVEVDSFGHFLMKARTSIVTDNMEPTWNADFEIDLDGAQTLRILCYKKEGETAELIGKGALELTMEKLRGEGCQEIVNMEHEMTLSTFLTYRSRQQTLKRTLSAAKEGLFGVRIRAVTRREGTKIPIIITSCVDEIQNRGLKDVGLYRVSGLSTEINRLKKAFEKNSRSSVSLLKSADTSVITGLLKLYLRELPEALFTDALYPKLVDGMELSDPEAKEKNMLQLMQSLPEPNYTTAMLILDHLIKVSEQENVNKMTIQNLATVFGPTLLRPADKEPDKVSVEELMSAGARDAMRQIAILCYLLSLKQKRNFGVRL